MEADWADALGDESAQALVTPRRSKYARHNPSPKQAAALVAHRFMPPGEPSEVFYGGAAGGGKSDWLLDGALEWTDLQGYAAIVFRRSYTDLALAGAIMSRSKEWLKGSDASWNETQKTWTFPSGASLAFAYLRAEDDKYRYQSAEFQYVGFDELTQFSEGQYTYLFSRLRRPAIKCSECENSWPCTIHPDATYDKATDPWKLALRKVPLRMCAASNPGGIGHGWVKKRFDLPSARRLPQGRVFIPARLSDNPHVDQKAYEASLKKLHPALAAQLLDGDWEAFEGQAYPELSEDVHAVDPLDLRLIELWGRHEGMDHGVTNPTAWLLFLTDYDGNVVVADEYYSPGTASRHAVEILERRREWWEARDEDGYAVRHVCWGDPGSLKESLAVESRIGDPLTLMDEYRRLGLALQPGNNRRRAGYVHLRELFEPSCGCSTEPLLPGQRCEACGAQARRFFPRWHPRHGETGAPRLFVVKSRCPNLWQQLVDAPIASGDNDVDRGEAVDRKWESEYGHCLVAGTLVTTASGPVPIEQASVGDRVLTRDGWRRVAAAGLTGRRQVFAMTLADGTTVVGTDSHPVLADGEWVPLGRLRSGTECLLLPRNATLTSGRGGCGRERTARSPRTTTSTMWTATRSTTSWGISSCGRPRNISASIHEARRLLRRLHDGVMSGPRRLRTPSSAAPRRDRSWAASWDAGCSPRFPWSSVPATSAAPSTRRSFPAGRGSAATPASHGGGAALALTTRQESVWSAEPSSPATGTRVCGRVLARAAVVSVRPAGTADVYNLSVAGRPEFFANGVLVHNSHAALRYGLLSPEARAREREEQPPDDPRLAARWYRWQRRQQGQQARERAGASVLW